MSKAEDTPTTITATPADAAAEPQTELVEVASKGTGIKQVVPREWLDHPVLKGDLQIVPSAR
jgi:hypothetical protein